MHPPHDLPPVSPEILPALREDPGGFPPRCDRCLHTLEPRGWHRTAAWVCPGCGLVRIA